MFTSSSVPDDIVRDMINKKIWNDTAPVQIERLRLLTISYYDFDEVVHHDGQMIVLDALSDKVISIFKELYNLKFPIAKIKLMNNYNGNDELSMRDNNSSCFIVREITGGGKPSIHSYGAAIDINPIQNPYVKPDEKGASVLPPMGSYYLNRGKIRDGMVEPIVEIFKKHGFSIWGGEWNDPIDYQHFQVTREEVEKLL